jgi:hypothetical protein
MVAVGYQVLGDVIVVQAADIIRRPWRAMAADG